MCELLAAPGRPTVDFVGVRFGHDPNLVWGPATAKAYTKEFSYIVRFPFVAVSRKLCAYLFSQRQVEAARDPAAADIMHCEVFAPSAAMAGGFACCDLTELMPGCVDMSIMMLEEPGFGRPMGAAFRGADGIRMYHPVYTPEDWLVRTQARFSPAAMAQHERLMPALVNLARERSIAQRVGDTVMLEAIEKFRTRLEPRWLEFFDRHSGQMPPDSA
jgi:hypothetical protein